MSHTRESSVCDNPVLFLISYRMVMEIMLIMNTINIWVESAAYFCHLFLNNWGPVQYTRDYKYTINWRLSVQYISVQDSAKTDLEIVCTSF